MSDALLPYAGWAVFAWVFVNQAGVPVPVVPWLVGAGALAASGGPRIVVTMAAAVAAARCADIIWYCVGRWRGAPVLSLLRRRSGKPGACLDRAERVFVEHKMALQFLARFLPELNAIVAGLAGASRVGVGRYVLVAVASAAAWASAWTGAGYFLSPLLHRVAPAVSIVIVLLVTLGAAAGVVVWYRRAAGATAALGLVTAVALAGCAVGPDYKRPAMETPPTWRTPAEETASLADIAWWDLFRDPVLRDLIATALEENKDLRLAVARVAEARAQLGVTRAAQFPQVDGQASYTNQRFSQKSFPFTALPPGVDPQQEFYRTSLDLTFELDLWGRLRRATEAARAELLASEENRRTVLTTLISDVAQAYFDLLELDREAQIDRQTLDSRRASLELVRRRFDEGLTNELDVRRAEGEVASAAARVPDVERRIAQTENRLSILLGRNPGAIPRGAVLEAQTIPPELPAGLPSALLERRPDVRQAEQRLVAANARIGQAKAEFFPRISLTGSFGVESVALSDLFTGPARVWQAGPAMTVPIFNAGRIAANLRATEARERQALIQYQQTIQQAFREANDALVFHRKARETRAEREQQVMAARQALTLADLRYKNGLSNYLDVLDAERQLLSAEIELAQTTRDRLTAVVQVYKALGGGWEVQE